MIPIISIVGKTNSGKTTLIERIIPEFKKKGYKVGVIKHDVHSFEIDHPGKDTWRMTNAGADNVIIASGEKMAMVKKLDREYNIDEISDWLLPDMDLIITEGYKRQDKPKIEVTRSGELICDKNSNLMSVVTNYLSTANSGLMFINTGVPCFRLTDTQNIVDFIEGKVLSSCLGV